MPRAWVMARRALIGAVLAGLLLWWVLPRLTGASLPEVRAAITAVSWGWLVRLTLIWAAGLLCFSFVLTAALPGLTRRRALTLNLTGSAVANVMSFGGAAGMSLNYLMLRRWGRSGRDFATYTVVTNAWVLMLKLALPAVALALLAVRREPTPPQLRGLAVVAAALLGAAVIAALTGLARRRSAERTAHAWGRLVAATWGRHGRITAADAADHLLGLRDQVAQVVSGHWWRLSLAMLGYTALQATLLGACLAAVGGGVSPTVLLAGYAADRVLTLAALTPGATGFAEAGIAGLLVALGGEPVTTAAGVLLYRAFTFALEIPVGGLWLAGWLVGQARHRGRGVR